jgi:hypothetical protein
VNSRRFLPKESHADCVDGINTLNALFSKVFDRKRPYLKVQKKIINDMLLTEIQNFSVSNSGLRNGSKNAIA